MEESGHREFGNELTDGHGCTPQLGLRELLLTQRIQGRRPGHIIKLKLDHQPPFSSRKVPRTAHCGGVHSRASHRLGAADLPLRLGQSQRDLAQQPKRDRP